MYLLDQCCKWHTYNVPPGSVLQVTHVWCTSWIILCMECPFERSLTTFTFWGLNPWSLKWKADTLPTVPYLSLYNIFYYYLTIFDRMFLSTHQLISKIQHTTVLKSWYITWLAVNLCAGICGFDTIFHDSVGLLLFCFVLQVCCLVPTTSRNPLSTIRL